MKVFKMVAVEEKISEQILALEPLFYYKEFCFKTKDIILLT
jgi:hypothetical protein